ncbi:hypothetical protein ACKKBG_A00705 [Auxenochlorella protothecoides x Auxenochlorella symbiontica]
MASLMGGRLGARRMPGPQARVLFCIAVAVVVMYTASSRFNLARAGINVPSVPTPLREDPVLILNSTFAPSHDHTKGGTQAAGHAGRDTSPSASGLAGRTFNHSLNPTHELTKELLALVAVDKHVILTLANWNRIDFIENWVHYMQATGCKAYLVGASDNKTLDWLVEREIPAFYVDAGSQSTEMWWGSKAFLGLMTARIAVDLKILQFGYSVLSTDADVVWMRDPLPFMLKYPEADILMSNDQLITTAEGEELEHWPASGWSANAGFKLFRPRAAQFVKTWIAEMAHLKKGEHDQVLFDRLIFSNAEVIPSRSDHLFRGFDRKLIIGSLPVSLFCSGQTYKERMPQNMGLKPYAVHATFQACTQAKINRLREYDLWKDPDAHFSHPVGFISYDRDIPQSLLDAAAKGGRRKDIASTLPHFDLVNHQLSQLRTQLILAEELGGAAAILPSMVAGMDSSYKAHNGTVPGSRLRLPYPAPSDQIIDMREMEERMPGRWREGSFLLKPRATSVNASVLVLTVCEAGADVTECAAGDAKAVPEHDQIRILPDRSLAQLRTALSGVFSKYKRLHVKGGIQRLMVLTPKELEGYSRKLNPLMSSHCCVEGSPGHIGYDLFWDLPGHRDRHGQVVPGPWKPVPVEMTSCT